MEEMVCYRQFDFPKEGNMVFNIKWDIIIGTLIYTTTILPVSVDDLPIMKPTEALGD